MIGHPVEDDLETLRVSLGEESVEVLQGTELGIDVTVIADGVVRAEAPLALQFAYGIDGHQPKDVHTEGLEARKLLLRRCESAFRRELPGVEFIDNGRVLPVTLDGPGRARQSQEAQGEYV